MRQRIFAADIWLDGCPHTGRCVAHRDATNTRTVIFSSFFKIKLQISSFLFYSLGGDVRIQLGQSYSRETQSQCNSPSQAHANTLCIIMYSVLISILRHVNFSQYVLAPQVTSEWKEMNRCPNLLYSESGQSLITLCTVAQVNLPDWSKQCVIVSTFLLHRPLPS